jgi:hypothetical protein
LRDRPFYRFNREDAGAAPVIFWAREESYLSFVFEVQEKKFVKGLIPVYWFITDVIDIGVLRLP